MDLNALNIRLAELATILPEKIRELQKAEYIFARRQAEVYLQSGFGTITAKEKEANAVCEAEGLWQPLTELRGDVKAFYNEKDMLIEISRNLRTLTGKEVRGNDQT